MRPPHNKRVRQDYINFLMDLETSVVSFLRESEANPDLLFLYKTATAAHATFESMAENDNSLLGAAAGVCRRVALLAMVRQFSLARVELRRLIECCVWYIYFIDHPIEWQEFADNPGRSWTADRGETPIADIARSEIGMFMKYDKERMTKDSSGVGGEAIGCLRTEYGNLSSEVHAAMGALHPGGSLALAFDKYQPATVGKLAKDSQRVFRASVLACASVATENLSRLDGISRGWFDWLVEAETARIIRSGTFGLQRDDALSGRRRLSR